MSSGQQNSKALIEQALEWTERLRAGDSDSEGFFDWLTESPRHVEVFMQAMTLEQRIAALAPEEWASLASGADAGVLVELEPANVVALKPANVVALSPPASASLPESTEPAGSTAPGESTEVVETPEIAGNIGRPGRFRWRALAAAAGVAAMALVAWWGIAGFGANPQFKTAVGEQRVIRLDDGSLVTLNTDTHIEVRMTDQARDIRLIDGEALFKVQRDPARPFRVHARDLVIQAVGTQFNVYRRATGTTVSVLEGRVRVVAEETLTARSHEIENAGTAGAATDSPLSAGEQVDISLGGQVERRSRLSPDRPIAWQQRRLIFDEEPLSNIVLEFNRYNHRPFRVADPQAAARRFSGIFDADDPDSLAQLLARDSHLDVERGSRETVIRAK